MVTEIQFEQANRRAAEMRAANPGAVAAKYDRTRGCIVVDLSNGLQISFNPSIAQGLENAVPAQLNEIKVSPSGFGIYFPKLDVDLYIPSLLEGVCGSKRWMAARLGTAGGQSRSTAKMEAARANGKLGGRPKRKAAAAGKHS